MEFLYKCFITFIVVGVVTLFVAYFYGLQKEKKRKKSFKSEHKYQGILLLGIILCVAGELGIFTLYSFLMYGWYDKDNYTKNDYKGKHAILFQRLQFIIKVTNKN